MLDIGSNSAQLQIVEVYPGAPPLPAHAVKAATRLGESYEPDGSLSAEAVDRVVDAVCRAMEAARRYSVEQLYAFVTSAVRDATNRDHVLARIEHDAGVRPQFLSGEDEARLTYLAVHRWYGWSSGRLLVIDIGGGSMEIVLGRDAEPELAISLPLGAGRLSREFLSSDPPSAKQLKALRRHVCGTLREVADRLRWEGDHFRAVATSKTFKQLARLAGAPPQRKGPFVRRTLTLADVADWLPRLASMPAKKRAKLRGVSQGRARQIVAGAVVAKATMQELDVRRLDVSPWALREGIILHYLQSSLDRTWELPLQPVRPEDPQLRASVTALPPRSTSDPTA
nr:Exopolyphosphatase [Kibdelosporangium sp. MJ126-NF4]CTQ90568.1 Exopolyphosphatase (EC 3.6.1.11) [Kibdelosporangium sp. MJ126-NF4]